MGYKLINDQSDIQKQNRLNKELKSFKDQLGSVVLKSHNLLQNLRDIADKKSREQLGNKVRDN